LEAIVQANLRNLQRLIIKSIDILSGVEYGTISQTSIQNLVVACPRIQKLKLHGWPKYGSDGVHTEVCFTSFAALRELTQLSLNMDRMELLKLDYRPLVFEQLQILHLFMMSSVDRNTGRWLSTCTWPKLTEVLLPHESLTCKELAGWLNHAPRLSFVQVGADYLELVGPILADDSHVRRQLEYELDVNLCRATRHVAVASVRMRKRRLYCQALVMLTDFFNCQPVV
jgi:hypothetical protein